MQVDLKSLTDFITHRLYPGGHFLVLKDTTLVRLVGVRAFRDLVTNEGIAQDDNQIFSDTDIFPLKPGHAILLVRVNGTRTDMGKLYCDYFSMKYIISDRTYEISQGVAWKERVYSLNGEEITVDGKDAMPEGLCAFYDYYLDRLEEEGTLIRKVEE